MRTLCCLATFAVPCVAQSLGFSATAAFSGNVVSGTQVVGNTVPLGPMTNHGALLVETTSPNAIARAQYQWHAYQAQTGLLATFHQDCRVDPGASSAASGPVDILVDLVAPVPTIVDLAIVKQIAASAGLPSPTVRVDVGGDGTVEVTETSSDYFAILALGPTPLSIRVTMDMAIVAPGVASASLELQVTPRTNTFVNQFVAACSFNSSLGLVPTFDGNLEVTLDANVPAVVVFGLAAQPQFLGTAFQLPCTLLPSPDYVVFPTPFQPFVLTIPSSARPVAIWTQGVALEFNGLTVSRGYQVQAN